MTGGKHRRTRPDELGVSMGFKELPRRHMSRDEMCVDMAGDIVIDPLQYRREPARFGKSNTNFEEKREYRTGGKTENNLGVGRSKECPSPTFSELDMIVSNMTSELENFPML